MRRNDFNGDHVYIGAVLSISSRIVCRLSGRKISKSFRLVIRRVLVGGVGCVSGGMLDRSKLREDLEEPRRSKRGRSGDEGEVGEVASGDKEPAMFEEYLSVRATGNRFVVGGRGELSYIYRKSLEYLFVEILSCVVVVVAVVVEEEDKRVGYMSQYVLLAWLLGPVSARSG